MLNTKEEALKTEFSLNSYLWRRELQRLSIYLATNGLIFNLQDSPFIFRIQMSI